MNPILRIADETRDWNSNSGAEDARIGTVIPVYNRRQTLLETLPFVLRQSLPPARLVIVDDGSTDGGAEVAEAWLADHATALEWQVVRLPHSTAAHARNRGFELVSDLPLVAFLDSDDHWPVDFLARTSALLLAQPEAVAASADRLFLGGEKQLLEATDLREMIARPVEWFFERGAGIASCTLLRSAVVEEVGNWRSDLASSEDTFLFTAVAQTGPWLHAPGEPVRFYLGSAAARHEEGNLSCRHDDRHLRWARDYEQLYSELIARDPQIPFAALHNSLAYRWTSAAKQLLALGRPDDARAAMDRALYWRPTSLRAWRHRLTLSLAKSQNRAA